MNELGGLPIEYSLMYARIRRIVDRIFIGCMNGSGGLLTEYSFSVCKGQADYRPNIH